MNVVYNCNSLKNHCYTPGGMFLNSSLPTVGFFVQLRVFSFLKRFYLETLSNRETLFSPESVCGWEDFLCQFSEVVFMECLFKCDHHIV